MTLFESADRAVAQSEELQSILRGERLILFLPGTSTFVAATMGLLLGWAALVVPFMSYVIVPDHPVRSMIGYFGSMFLTVAVVCVPTGLVIRGQPLAHQIECWICRALLGVAAIGTLIAAWTAPSVVLICATTALVLFAVVDRGLRSPSYALLAALFRAKRVATLDQRRRRDQVLSDRR